MAVIGDQQLIVDRQNLALDQAAAFAAVFSIPSQLEFALVLPMEC